MSEEDLIIQHAARRRAAAAAAAIHLAASARDPAHGLGLETVIPEQSSRLNQTVLAPSSSTLIQEVKEDPTNLRYIMQNLEQYKQTLNKAVIVPTDRVPSVNTGRVEAKRLASIVWHSVATLPVFPKPVEWHMSPERTRFEWKPIKQKQKTKVRLGSEYDIVFDKIYVDAFNNIPENYDTVPSAPNKTMAKYIAEGQFYSLQQKYYSNSESKINNRLIMTKQVKPTPETKLVFDVLSRDYPLRKRNCVALDTAPIVTLSECSVGKFNGDSLPSYTVVDSEKWEVCLPDFTDKYLNGLLTDGKTMCCWTAPGWVMRPLGAMFTREKDIFSKCQGDPVQDPLSPFHKATLHVTQRENNVIFRGNKSNLTYVPPYDEKTKGIIVWRDGSAINFSTDGKDFSTEDTNNRQEQEAEVYWGIEEKSFLRPCNVQFFRPERSHELNIGETVVAGATSPEFEDKPLKKGDFLEKRRMLSISPSYAELIMRNKPVPYLSLILIKQTDEQEYWKKALQPTFINDTKADFGAVGLGLFSGGAQAVAGGLGVETACTVAGSMATSFLLGLVDKYTSPKVAMAVSGAATLASAYGVYVSPPGFQEAAVGAFGASALSAGRNLKRMFKQDKYGRPKIQRLRPLIMNGLPKSVAVTCSPLGLVYSPYDYNKFDEEDRMIDATIVRKNFFIRPNWPTHAETHSLIWNCQIGVDTRGNLNAEEIDLFVKAIQTRICRETARTIDSKYIAEEIGRFKLYNFTMIFSLVMQYTMNIVVNEKDMKKSI